MHGNFSGTSAAAPVVSVIALMLEANKKLGYRDVQNILAYSARQELVKVSNSMEQTIGMVVTRYWS